MNRLNRVFPVVPAPLKKLRWFRAGGLRLLLLPGLCGVIHAAAPPTNSVTDQIADVQVEMDHAIEQVQKIVNQPVSAYARKPGMEVGTYPYWFHEGANKPDFNIVDVRTTRESIYDKFEYVTSDLNPGVVFRGRDLEFNSSTKYFYTDRSAPKKKLTEAEMLEINRLYRIIGHCEHQLLVLQPPPKLTETNPDTAPEIIVDRFPILKSTATHVTLGIVLLLAVVFLVRKRFAAR